MQETAAKEDAKYAKILSDQSVKHHARMTILAQKVRPNRTKSKVVQH